jgi:ElaB/YqjD/DUF883 family membrane-anchored ribosome-binding protein
MAGTVPEHSFGFFVGSAPSLPSNEVAMADKMRSESSSNQSGDRFGSGPIGTVNPKTGSDTGKVSVYGEAEKPSDTSFAEELASLKETVASLVSSAGSGAMKTMRDAGDTVATQVGNAASGAIQVGADAATYAGEQAKTFASEVEGFARRNPLGALGAALAVGVLIGMIGRSRN